MITDPIDSAMTRITSSGSWNGETMSFRKIALIASIVLATVVANMLIAGLITERETRQTAVELEFTRAWGPSQHLYSPILVVPFRSDPTASRRYVKLAPARLELTANLLPQERRRGLFHATVYDAKVEMLGSFTVPDESRLRELLGDRDRTGQVLWNETFVVLGTTTSLTGLRADDRIAVNGADMPWQPCLELLRDDRACGGASIVAARANVDAAPAGAISFRSSISLRGTTSFNLMFGGKELDATIRSSWPTPSFGIDVLPVTSSVTADGFEARWQIAEFGVPRISTTPALADSALWKGATIGVDLIEATPVYRSVNRVAKYSLLFVVLAFATYVFFELLSRLRIHIVQYGMLGLSLSMFALLLLALSEPIGYPAGYLVSAGLVLIQSTLYTAAVARRALPALVFAGMLTSLFAFLYVVLGLETYSLVFGSLALFVAVSALMVLTQTVNWLAAWRGGAETRGDAQVPTPTP